MPSEVAAALCGRLAKWNTPDSVPDRRWRRTIQEVVAMRELHHVRLLGTMPD